MKKVDNKYQLPLPKITVNLPHASIVISYDDPSSSYF